MEILQYHIEKKIEQKLDLIIPTHSVANIYSNI